MGRLIVVALIGALTGCSAPNSLLLSPGALSLSGETEPFPENYLALAQHHFGFHRKLNLQVSRPQNLIGASLMDVKRWYVCVRQPDDENEVVLVISKGKIEGTILGPAPDLCDAGVYEALN